MLYQKKEAFVLYLHTELGISALYKKRSIPSLNISIALFSIYIVLVLNQKNYKISINKKSTYQKNMESERKKQMLPTNPSYKVHGFSASGNWLAYLSSSNSNGCNHHVRLL